MKRTDIALNIPEIPETIYLRKNEVENWVSLENYVLTFTSNLKHVEFLSV